MHRSDCRLVRHYHSRVDEIVEVGKQVFEWDADKARSNLRRHGVSFPEATDVFFDPFIRFFESEEEVDGEERLTVMGEGRSLRLLLVVHTERSERRRISARLATSHERRLYEQR